MVGGGGGGRAASCEMVCGCEDGVCGGARTGPAVLCALEYKGVVAAADGRDEERQATRDVVERDRRLPGGQRHRERRRRPVSGEFGPAMVVAADAVGSLGLRSPKQRRRHYAGLQRAGAEASSGLDGGRVSRTHDGVRVRSCVLWRSTECWSARPCGQHDKEQNAAKKQGAASANEAAAVAAPALGDDLCVAQVRGSAA